MKSGVCRVKDKEVSLSSVCPRRTTEGTPSPTDHPYSLSRHLCLRPTGKVPGWSGHVVFVRYCSLVGSESLYPFTLRIQHTSSVNPQSSNLFFPLLESPFFSLIFCILLYLDITSFTTFCFSLLHRIL